ncbi:MAG: hypothetical protein ACR2NR_01505 [Solirubrobacteraceae bacterium]
MRKLIAARITKALTVFAILAAGALLAPGALAAPATSTLASVVNAANVFTSRVFASGKLMHPGPKGQEPISQPDDITSLGGHIFVTFQDGVGPQGEASPTGNRDSTIVEFNLHGHVVDRWDVVGKCDGLTADPATGRIIATVNEDAHSSLYLIDPAIGSHPVHYRYATALPSHGGTDAIELYHGMILISASAPGTTGSPAPQPTYPAVYRVALDAKRQVATIHGLFSDEASAKVANTSGAQAGRRLRLGLTDPDSNEDVPSFADRFAGDFMLTSQGDKEQIFVSDAGGAHQTMSALKLSDSVDDTAWPSDHSGALYATNGSNTTIERITGPFTRGSVLVADTPCDASGAPSTCPGPGFPQNYLGELNPNTGLITPVTVHGAGVAPKGMVFLP